MYQKNQNKQNKTKKEKLPHIKESVLLCWFSIRSGCCRPTVDRVCHVANNIVIILLRSKSTWLFQASILSDGQQWACWVGVCERKSGTVVSVTVQVYLYLYFIFRDITANTQINNLQGLQKIKTLDTEIQNTKQPRRITQKKQCFCQGVLQTEWDTCK